MAYFRQSGNWLTLALADRLIKATMTGCVLQILRAR
jgi:hypothetical protein